MIKQNKLIFGIHTIKEALDAGKELDKVFVRRGLKNEDVQTIIQQAKERIIPIQIVPEEKLNRICRQNHQGVVAFLSQIEYTQIEQLLPTIYENGETPFLIILDGLTDVRNFGAIARTAECVGADAIIIPDKGSVSVTGDAIKTSAGALLRIPVCRVSSIPETVTMLQNYGIKVAVASEKASALYTEAKLDEPLALVMGSEEKGASNETLVRADEMLAIPQRGEINSLNVSVAAGILMYEVLRQRSL